MIESRISPMVPPDERVEVGRFTYGSPDFKLWSDEDRISIGSFCSIADEVVIFGGGEHNLGWVTTFPMRLALGDPRGGFDGHPRTKGHTRIGNDVWIGLGAIVLSGVTIGDGAVIGAGAVVVRDVAPYHVVAGNPAKVLRRRFDDHQIDRLLQLRWWDWPMERIVEFTDLLCSEDVEGFLRAGSEVCGSA